MSDFSDAAKRVSKLKDDLKEGHKRATNNAMTEMRNDVQTTILANDSVARRKLITDVRHTETEAGVLVSRSVNVPGWAKYLEHGTGARGDQTSARGRGRYKTPSPVAPIDPILTWIVAKNIVPEEYDSRIALAQAIASTIGAEGTYAHPFLRPVWYSNRGYRNVIDENKRAMRRALRRF